MAERGDGGDTQHRKRPAPKRTNEETTTTLNLDHYESGDRCRLVPGADKAKEGPKCRQGESREAAGDEAGKGPQREREREREREDDIFKLRSTKDTVRRVG